MKRSLGLLLSPLRLPFAELIVALGFSLAFDLGRIDPEFFALVAQILPVLLLATLFEPSQTTASLRRAEPTPTLTPSSSQRPQELPPSASSTLPVDTDLDSPIASERDSDTENTLIDSAELEGLDLDELMAKVMPKIEAARARAKRAEATQKLAEEWMEQAEREHLNAKRDLATASANYAQLKGEARTALRASIWALFVGEAAALYAVGSRQHTTFLAVFCALSVLSTFWIVAEGWIGRAISTASTGQD